MIITDENLKNCKVTPCKIGYKYFRKNNLGGNDIMYIANRMISDGEIQHLFYLIRNFGFKDQYPEIKNMVYNYIMGESNPNPIDAMLLNIYYELSTQERLDMIKIIDNFNKKHKSEK